MHNVTSLGLCVISWKYDGHLKTLHRVVCVSNVDKNSAMTKTKVAK